jgi:hypothetical protein
MVFNFQSIPDNIQDEAFKNFVYFYLISIIFWPIYCIYLLYRLKGIDNNDIGETLNRISMILINTIGGFFYILLPFLTVIGNEDIGYFPKLAIFILTIIFTIIFLYYIAKFKNELK